MSGLFPQERFSFAESIQEKRCSLASPFKGLWSSSAMTEEYAKTSEDYVRSTLRRHFSDRGSTPLISTRKAPAFCRGFSYLSFIASIMHDAERAR
jgi:hypothetical protein